MFFQNYYYVVTNTNSRKYFSQSLDLFKIVFLNEFHIKAVGSSIFFKQRLSISFGSNLLFFCHCQRTNIQYNQHFFIYSEWPFVSCPNFAGIYSNELYFTSNIQVFFFNLIQKLPSFKTQYFVIQKFALIHVFLQKNIIYNLMNK